MTDKLTLSELIKKSTDNKAGSNETQDYDVGYKKPPKSTQFKKGVSGNPRGRPRGVRNKRFELGLKPEALKELFKSEAYREISIQDRGRSVKMPAAQALIRAIIHKALKGNVAAQKFVFVQLSKIEAEDRRESESALEWAIEYKSTMSAELAHREKHGIVHLPDPIPHPDDVLIDPRQGIVTIRGPLDEKEKRTDEYHRALLKDLQNGLVDSYHSLRKHADDPQIVSIIEEDIELGKTMIVSLKQLIGPEEDDLEPFEAYDRAKEAIKRGL